jgi:hypothetical protein
VATNKPTGDDAREAADGLAAVAVPLDVLIEEDRLTRDLSQRRFQASELDARSVPFVYASNLCRCS